MDVVAVPGRTARGTFQEEANPPTVKFQFYGPRVAAARDASKEEEARKAPFTFMLYGFRFTARFSAGISTKVDHCNPCSIASWIATNDDNTIAFSAGSGNKFDTSILAGVDEYVQ